MRLWSFHPKYLDTKGLLAVWREGLLARAVLQGLTKGYKNHPQLERFKNSDDPVAAISFYLAVIFDESKRREYKFDRSKVGTSEKQAEKIPVSKGQLLYEWDHFKKKISVRDTSLFETLKVIRTPEIHPLFFIVNGGVEPWEKLPD